MAAASAKNLNHRQLIYTFKHRKLCNQNDRQNSWPSCPNSKWATVGSTQKVVESMKAAKISNAAIIKMSATIISNLKWIPVDSTQKYVESKMAVAKFKMVDNGFYTESCVIQNDRHN